MEWWIGCGNVRLAENAYGGAHMKDCRTAVLWGWDVEMALPLDTNMLFDSLNSLSFLSMPCTSHTPSHCVHTLAFVKYRSNMLHPHHNLPLLPPSLYLLLPAQHGARRLLLSALGCAQTRLLPQIQPNHVLHIPSIMLDCAHVRQSRTSRPLRRALHNLDALHQRTVDLVPHLHAHAGELAAQQDRRVDAAAPDVDAHAGEGVAGALAHEQDVADARAFGVVFCEEAGSRAGGVEQGGLGSGDGGDGVGAGFLDVALRVGEDGDAELSDWG